MSCRIFDIEHKEVDEEESPLLVPTSISSSAFSSINSSDTVPCGTVAENDVTPSDESVHPLECAWLTRSFTSDEFEKFLGQEQNLMNFTNSENNTTAFIPHKFEEEQVEDMVDFDTFLATSSAYLSSSYNSASSSSPSQSSLSHSSASPSPYSVSSSSSSKKRGRPAKPDPVSLVLSKTVSAPAKSASPIASSPRSPSPSPKRESSPPADMTNKYLKMRRSNNESSMKSRLRRKEKEAQNADLVDRLAAENGELRDQLYSLRAEFAQLKSILEKHLQS